MKDKNQSDESKIKIALEYSNNIIATLREPFLVLDKNLRVISSNQSFYTTFEVAEKDTIGRSIADLGDRQWDIPELLFLLKEILPKKKVVKDYEVEHKFEHIGERIMILNACQLRVPKKIAAAIAKEEEEEEEEEEDLVLLAIEDITERKFLKYEELRESESKYRLLFDNVPLSVGITTLDGKGIMANRGCEELTGYSKEEFSVLKDLSEMYVDRAQRKQLMVLLQKEGKVRDFEAALKRKDGTVYYALMNLNFIELAGEQLILTTVRDITERKKAEAALRLSGQSFQEILNNIEGLVYVADMKTYETLFINKYGKKIWGDFTGKTCWQNLQLGQKSPCSFCTNDRLLHPDGTFVGVYLWEFQNTVTGQWFECRDSAIFWPDGRTVRMEIAMDITERKKMEEEARKRLQELEVFYKASVSREERILELKKEVEQLKKELGK
jgi:PAS domain S-box-containing protein